MKTNVIEHEINEWSDEVENLLKNMAEKAQIWRLLNIEGQNHFKKNTICC